MVESVGALLEVGIAVRRSRRLCVRAEYREGKPQQRHHDERGSGLVSDRNLRRDQTHQSQRRQHRRHQHTADQQPREHRMG